MRFRRKIKIGAYVHYMRQTPCVVKGIKRRPFIPVRKRGGGIPQDEGLISDQLVYEDRSKQISGFEKFPIIAWVH